MEKIFTFEISKDGEAIDIHLNDEGIEQLLRSLATLKRSGKQNHDHLMTEAWGGNELSEKAQAADSKLIHQVNLRYWPQKT